MPLNFHTFARRLCTLFFSAVCFAIPPNGHADDGWKISSKSGDLTIYERTRAGSDLREYKAVGNIAASPAAVKAVLDDVEAYPSFMPYVKEARVISRDANSRVSYQRIAPPMVSDRDYTIRVRTETSGSGFLNRWTPANDLGPAETKGVTRVKNTEGSWLLEPAEGGRATLATYCIYTDSGGGLPVFIANAAGKTAIPKLFDAIRKQVKLPKYQHAGG